MKTKRKVAARIFSFRQDTHQEELIVTNKAELLAQVKQSSHGNPQALQLAKLAWTDERSDITIGSMRIACIGQMIRETWVSPSRPTEPKAETQTIEGEKVGTELQPKSQTEAELSNAEDQPQSQAQPKPSVAAPAAITNEIGDEPLIRADAQRSTPWQGTASAEAASDTSSS
ncbi:hypothetical protein [Deinococcus radiophilus]|uniref:Uncharacterized protein n=1 Tax=Deinococcus radiophilus TaxID=32062 RepID=A0A431VKU1_9DEIO|nr:hypothetical protein [Deinococcus radiophilus]RTR22118.1 hypothetical protein EJ104_12880 [Deinococcus radiophilus]UFA51934.1 hypothetical protein LMT64_13335 [Deinococcus radiophilus]